jgi:hypothetical protein
MRNDEAARQSSRSTPIRTPDQLQQARRPEAPRPGGKADRPTETGEARQSGGVLDQLQSERAHD